MTDFREMTIIQMHELMEQGKTDSCELVRFYLKRIEEFDTNGPSLNSLLELNPQALDIATSLDRERKEQGSRSILHGIPFLIKGNIDTADSMETTAGSLAMKGHIAEKDAFIISRLREAGAVILGKTNLSEWANFRSSRSSSGWSSAGGQTRNPYVLDRSPCGSSSGSAVAVSANLCAAAIGSETDGSIVCPSHMNGIVGIKPTLGLVSRSGIIPIAHSQDTAGPMARTVSDAAALHVFISGYDKNDTKSDSTHGVTLSNINSVLDKNALKGARIGVSRNFFGIHEKVDELMEHSIKLMKDNGAVIVDPAEIETKNLYNDEELEVMLYEFKAGLNQYLSTAKGQVKSLQELIRYNKREKEQIMPWFQQETLEKAQAKGPLSDSRYIESLKKCRLLSRDKGIDLTVKKYNLNAIIAPTGGPAWKIDLIGGDHYPGGSSQVAAVSGYPHITVPMGFVSGLPVGISFIGGAFSDSTLIGLAYAFEQLGKARKEPEYIPGGIGF